MCILISVVQPACPLSPTIHHLQVQDIALDSNLCKNPSANNSQTVDAFGNAAFATTADSWAAQQLDQGLQPAAKQQLAGRCRLCKVDKPSTSATGCACCQLMIGMSPGALMHLLLFGRLRPDKTAVSKCNTCHTNSLT